MVAQPSGASPPVEPAPEPVLPRRNGRFRAVWLGLLITFCALATIGTVTYIGWNIASAGGPAALGVGLAGAILPVPVLVACFLWLDRYQPSPLWILFSCFLWGAGIATSGALLVNEYSALELRMANRGEDLVGVLVAPFIEESLKALLPILIYVFYRKAYTGIVDAVVYCGLSATGFAMVENVLYLGGHGFAGESDKGTAAGALAVTTIFILRVPLTGFAHPLFTSMTALGLGIGARSPSRMVRVAAPLAGLLSAMMLHGSWNLIALLSQAQAYIILYGYFAVYMPIFFAMVGLVLWARSREGRLAERVLPVYVPAGWFSPPELAALGTLGRRLSALRWAGRVAGKAGQSAMRAYQIAATRLALVRDGLNRGLYPSQRELANAVAEERQLLIEIDVRRRLFTGRDPMTPRAFWTQGQYQIEFADGVRRTIAAPALLVVPVPVPLAPAAAPGPYQ